MDHACKRCQGGMIDEAVLCHPCTDRLAGRLADIPVLLTELNITLARLGTKALAVIPTQTGGSVHPDMTVSLVAAGLRGAVAGWAWQLDRYTGPKPWERLWERLDTVRLQDWSPMLDMDLARHTTRAWEKIDKPADRWYAGVCGGEMPGTAADCTRVLWAGLDDDEIRCRDCHTTWSVPERRACLIRFAEDQEGNATMVASVVSYVLRRRVPPATVRSWAFRGLIPRQRDGLRVGDAIEIAMRNDKAIA